MGIALSAVHGLFTPLQDLLAWLVSPIHPSDSSAAVRTAQRCPAVNRGQAGTVRTALPSTLQAAACGRQAARPLRVVRVMDRDGNRARAGSRMVISGRMADVCAELDRLAALEQVRH